MGLHSLNVVCFSWPRGFWLVSSNGLFISDECSGRVGPFEGLGFRGNLQMGPRKISPPRISWKSGIHKCLQDVR